MLRTLCLPVLHARLSTSGVGVGLFLPLLAGGVWVVRGGEEGGGGWCVLGFPGCRDCICTGSAVYWC